MKGSRSLFLKFLVLLVCCALISSCSGLDLFGKNPDPEQDLEDPGQPLDADLELARLTRALEKAEQEKGIKDKTISELEEKIHGLELKVRDLEKLIAQKKPAVIQLEYIEPVQLYQKARNLLLEGDAVNAAQLFQSFAEHHPNHSLADNALYWLGECYYSLGRYTKAIEEFKNLVKTYPKAEKVPDALLKIGYSFLSMDDINRAGHFLKQVLKKYPFSPAAEKAEIKLKSIE